MESLKFEQLPNLVADLRNEVKEMKSLLLKTETQQRNITNNLIGIKEVAKLTGLTVPTLYGYCQRNEIPYSKKGNRLFFFEEEIISWIKTGKRKTLSEIQIEAENYISNKK